MDNDAFALQLIYEGMYDPCTFKAIFVVGGPGSGKTWATKKLGLQHIGFVSIDSDYPLEKYMSSANLSLKMPPEEHDERTIVRQKAKGVTSSKEESVLDQRLGIVVSETGSDISDTLGKDSYLRKLGYDTAMIFVNADMETAANRNFKRARSVPNEIVQKKWIQSQSNMGKYQQQFNPFWIIDNSENSNVNIQLTNVYKKIIKWCEDTPNNPEVIKTFKRWKHEKRI